MGLLFPLRLRVSKARITGWELLGEGTFTGKLALAGLHYPVKGTFTPYGTFNGSVRAGKAVLEVALSVDTAAPGVSGSITATTPGGSNTYSVDSVLLGKFNKTNPLPAGLAGKYTAIMPILTGTDSTSPQAPGYGTMSVAATGAVHIAGKLGDGTAFSAAGQLCHLAKRCVLFNSLYGGKSPGSIAGNITFESGTNSDCDGVLDWVKQAQSSGAYYPGGFSVSTNLLAAKYAALALTSGTFTLTGGNLSAAGITDNLTVSSGDKVSVSGSNDVTITLTLGTGAFSGKFLDPVTDKKTSFSGVIYQEPAPGAGYGMFLGTDECGSVKISQ